MDPRKSLRIGKKIVHGREGPLRGDMKKIDETYKMKTMGNEENLEHNVREEPLRNVETQNIPIKTNEKKQPSTEDKKESPEEEVIPGAKGITSTEAATGDSLDIFEQMLQRELAKGALGGGVVASSDRKRKSVLQKAEAFTKVEEVEGGTDDMESIPLRERIKHTQVKYRIHGLSEIVKCFSSDDMAKKKEMLDDLFKSDEGIDILSKALADANVVCQLKAAEMCNMYLTLIKDVYFFEKRNEGNSEETEEALNLAFSSENRANLFSLYVKINSTLCEKILINAKAFDHGYNIICKIIEYCSSDTITTNIITMLCDHLNAIVDKAEKNVANIKGVKIKVVASELMLFYKLLHTYGPSVMCIKTINKCCLRFNTMTDKTVKENFYSLYIEILTWIKSSEFQNSILNLLSAQQKNHILKELQKDANIEKRVPKSTYLIKKTRGEADASIEGEEEGHGKGVDLLDEVDLFSKVCTKQWEQRVLEGSFDKASAGDANSLSNENLLPWKIKVEALNLLYDKMKTCYSIKRTSYTNTLLNILVKLLKNESAIPVIISCLKLVTVCIEHFKKDIYSSVRVMNYILCSKLKDSNKQVSNASSECILKSLEHYSIDIYLDDISKNLKDKNNNSRLVTVELLLKGLDLVDRKGASQIVEIAKQTINDPIANIKNASFKLFSKIISLYGEEIAPAFFNSIPANKKKSILALCTTLPPGMTKEKIGEGMSELTGSGGGRMQRDISNRGGSQSNTADNYAAIGKVGTTVRKINKEENVTSGNVGKGILVDESVENVLPKAIVANFLSNNYVQKIEALNFLNEWLKDKNNFSITNLENLFLFVKKNCFDFKGKYVQLNAAVFDFFYNLMDTVYYFNAHETNPNFTKILNNILTVYLDKITDKKESMVCNNFIAKCFNYFDNTVIIDIIIKNNDGKNTKKCEDTIKLLQKILITKNNTQVHVKNLILFLKKFVDSKNNNLRNATILLLQILSKNFGDRFVLAHLEGISETVRQTIKMKEDIERFLTRQGMAAVPGQSPLPSKTSMVLNTQVSSMAKMSNAGTPLATGANTQRTSLNKPTPTDNLEKFPQSRTEYEMENENSKWNFKGKGNKTSFPETEEKEYGGKEEIFRKYNESTCDDGVGRTNRELNDGNIKIDYSKKCLNYATATQKEGMELKGKRYSGAAEMSKRGEEQRRGEREKREEDEDEEALVEEAEEKVVSISEIIKPYIYKVNNEINKNIINSNALKIIKIIEENARHRITPEGLEILLNKNVLQKIYMTNKNNFIHFLNVIIIALRETPEAFSNILFESIINLVDDGEIPDETIDRLLSRQAKTLGISLYINEINSLLLNERMNSNSMTSANIAGEAIGGMGLDGEGDNPTNNTGRGSLLKARGVKRNKVLMAINAIRISHLLLLNENTIKKKILKLYLDLFFDDHEELREKASIVLDHIYSKFGENVFLYVYDRFSPHKKEYFQDIINKMKTKSEDLSFHKIFLSNNSQIKRMSLNESNSNLTTPNAVKSKSMKRQSSLSVKKKVEKLEFPPNYKIKPDKLKWGATLDTAHLNYLTKEFKNFASEELINNMFSDKINLIHKSIAFYKEYLKNGANQSAIYSRAGFTDLLLKWIFCILNGKPYETIANLVNLILLILRKMEHNYTRLSDQLLYCLFHAVFNKVDTSVTSDVATSTSVTSVTSCAPAEIRRTMKKILTCLCYISNERLYFSLLLRSMASCQQETKIRDSLDIILKLLILYKEKCIKFETDVIRLLQVFTLNSKKKNIALSCLRIFANMQSFYPNFYKCVENDEISNYLKNKVNQFIQNHPNYNEYTGINESDDDQDSVNSGDGVTEES